MTIAYLGPRGSFSEVAALNFDPSGDSLPCANFPEIVASVERGAASHGILPVENSIEGAISTNLDILIHETELRVCAEVIVPVRHFLIVPPGTTLADITTVSSHPQALAQCRHWLEANLPNAEIVAALSTSGAVEKITQGIDRGAAAIGTERAADLYGGTVIARDIHDVRANVTRFVVINEHDGVPTGDDKTNLAFTVKRNQPGSIHRAISVFADSGIQLTKIESRPTKAWLGDYVFLLDLEGHRTDPKIASAIERMSDHCDWVKVFGSYPRFPMESLRGFIDVDDPAAATRMGLNPA
jgi:prephenate dehydratase